MVIKHGDYEKEYRDLKQVNVISQSCFSIIAAYFIQLHPKESPRTNAIIAINKVMGYLPLQSTNLPTMNTITTHDYINNDNEVLLPIIANFTQATARNLSHHQHWLLLHSGVMHSSSSTMKHVIQKHNKIRS